MLNNVFLKTLRDRRRSLVWWSLGVFVFALFIGLFWPILRDSQDQLRTVLATFPDELFGLFGVASADEMFTPAGYVSSRAFGLLVPVVFAVYAAAMGAQLIAGEEEAHTMDLLLANPVPRERIVWQKWLAMVAVMAILGLALLAAVVIADIAFGLGIPFDRYFAASLQATLLGLVFGSVAFAAGALGAPRGLTLGIVSALAVATFLVNSLGTVTDWMEKVRVVSPFYYYDSKRPLVEGFDVVNALILAAVAVAGVLVARWGFPRRDVRI
ncbi:MAG: ABC transporter permease subunit [Bauldia sp.]